jgi:porin
MKETQFAFGVAGGIDKPVAPPLGEGNVFEYTGRGEYDANLDLEKLVGLSQGKLLVRMENWYGEYGNVSLRTGAFAAPVFAALTPVSPNHPGVPFVTTFLYTQQLSDDLLVYAGKKDVFGSMDQDIFAGGDGTEQFVNFSLFANPALLLGLPYTSVTAGFVSSHEWGAFSTYIYDPTERTEDFFRLNNLFSDGIVVGSELMLKTNFFGLPGQQRIGGVWKHVPLTDLNFAEPPPGVYPEPTVPGFPTINNSWTVYHGCDQYLVQFPGSDRGWGLFGRASVSDGNPTPIKYFLSAGVGGFSPFGQQRGDAFGVGWYFVGASSQFGPLPRALYGPQNGTGVEMYYKFQLTRWLDITDDFQLVQPESSAIAKDAFIYGVRLNLKF